MVSRTKHRVLGAISGFAVSIGSTIAQPLTEGVSLFVGQALPILEARCGGCHGEAAEKLKGELDLRTLDGALRGGESERPALAPGDPEGSPLWVSTTWGDPDLQMPPKENDRLTQEEIAALGRWIELGAPWLSGDALDAARAQYREEPSVEGTRVTTSGGLHSSWTDRAYAQEDLWAFRPVSDPVVPGSQGPEAIGDLNPVDAFLDRRLGAQGLEAAPKASRRQWLRRVTYDLTGLPPTTAEVEAYLSDGSENADVRVIDRLLASPHFGERWAIRWLDVARYADTAGFSNDHARPNAWRYRDYVIRAFNQDKPYDQFIREQLAGDLIDPDNPEMAIATGYLRMGPWEHTAMSVEAVTRQQWLDDVTNAVGVTFLAQELGCAKCHDHKFDPIPTRDYYKIQACFATTQPADISAPFLPVENRRGINEGRERIQGLIAAGGGRGLRSLPEEERPDWDYDLDTEEKGHKKVNGKRNAYLQRELKRFAPVAMGVYDGPYRTFNSNSVYSRPPESIDPDAIWEPTHILLGGALERPGDPVQPGTLSAVVSLAEVPAAITEGPQGRRLDLARWIARPENPLTARAMVNRVWQAYFRTGLAANPNNFGKMGAKPSHPELLDYLARRFVEDGWSIKRLSRLLLTSKAYRRSSTPIDPRVAEIDPENRSLSFFPARRLTAEEIRDSLLAVSGALNGELGGIPNRPEIHQEVAMQPRHIMGSVGPAYQPDPEPSQRNRRSLYAERIRTMRDPFLEVFNQPGYDTSTERRNASTVTPQALTLLNSRESLTRARQLAIEVDRVHPEDPAERVAALWRRVYGRGPGEEEMTLALTALQRGLKGLRAQPVEREARPRYVIREMLEEMTGLNFYWVEDLDLADAYRPDFDLASLSPETRALADIALVLFNSNEFLYLD